MRGENWRFWLPVVCLAGFAMYSAQKLVRDVVRVHLRVRREGGGVEAARDVHLVLAGGRHGRFAVEEARDVAELLRLGDAELA